MKFKCIVAINRSKDVVAKYFENPDYLIEYQDGFLGKELVSGTHGENGAVSKMLYKMGKGQMELTETIIENNLPHSFYAQYQHKHMDNTMLCKFIELDANNTQYISEIHYTKFRGFMPKLMAFLFPSMFKRQVDKWLLNFKNFVEKQ